MRRSTYILSFTTQSALVLGASMLCLAASTGSAHATDPIYQVDLNKTQILRLPTAAGSVIIGNPAIADVTVHSPTTIMVVGRGFGETNLIVLDRNGDTMVDADIQVTSITPSNGVRLFNGKSRQTYSCAPYCQPSPVLGDSAEHISTNSSQGPATASPSAIFDQGSSGPVGLTGGSEADAPFGGQPAFPN
ncbi:MAG: pilus assembly protein N-terminal domain-containing protein [Litorimonas sp.]